jgi:phosphatidylinositol-3-phosphatase
MRVGSRSAWRALVLAACVVAGCAAAPPTVSVAAPTATGTAAVARSASARPTATTPGPISPAAVLRTPCGWRTPPPSTYRSVVWIWLENRSVDQVVGNPTMPALNALARRCALATNSHSITHPSLPNYLAAVSGSTGGVVSDCGPAACPQRRTTLFDQVTAKHKTWRTYAQGMPVACSRTTSYPYAPKHNPAVYFPALRRSCLANDVPLGTATSGRLSSALRTGAMPSFALVVPGLCDDGHDCPSASADRWIATWLPKLLTSRQYRAGTMAIVITYDEGAGGSAGQSCTNSSAVSCLVPTVVLAPSVRPGTRVTTSISHYSLLRTTEELLGIRAHLGLAARARSLRAALHL